MNRLDGQGGSSDLLDDLAFKANVARVFARTLGLFRSSVATAFQNSSMFGSSALGHVSRYVFVTHEDAGVLVEGMRVASADGESGVSYCGEVCGVDFISSRASGLYLVLWNSRARIRILAICKFDDGRVAECVVSPDGFIDLIIHNFPADGESELWKIGRLQDCM